MTSEEDFGTKSLVEIKLKEYEQIYELIRGRVSAIEKRIFYALTGYGFLIASLLSTTNIENIEKFNWVIAVFVPAYFFTLVVNTLYQITGFERARKHLVKVETKINELIAQPHFLQFESHAPGVYIDGGYYGIMTFFLQFTIGFLALSLNVYLGYIYQIKTNFYIILGFSIFVFLFTVIFVFKKLNKFE